MSDSSKTVKISTRVVEDVSSDDDDVELSQLYAENLIKPYNSSEDEDNYEPSTSNIKTSKSIKNDTEKQSSIEKINLNEEINENGNKITGYENSSDEENDGDDGDDNEDGGGGNNTRANKTNLKRKNSSDEDDTAKNINKKVKNNFDKTKNNETTNKGKNKKNTEISLEAYVHALCYLTKLIIKDENYSSLDNLDDIISKLKEFDQKNYAKKFFKKFDNYDCVDEIQMQNIVFKVTEKLFYDIENTNLKLSFSREYFKYFLATYIDKFTVEDFLKPNQTKLADSAQSKNKFYGSKKMLNANKSPLPGKILEFYMKQPKSILYRCDDKDLDTLMMLFNNNISLNRDTYTFIQNIVSDDSWKNFDIFPHTVEYQFEEKVDDKLFVKIPIFATQQLILLITRKFCVCVNSLRNNKIFSFQNILEKYVSQTTMSKLNEKEYIFVEAISDKSKIIGLDIFWSGISDKYSDRKLLAMEKLPELFENEHGTETFGYAVKSRIGLHATSFYRVLPNPTVAAIGCCSEYVWVTYLDDNDDKCLIYKDSRYPISPISNVVTETAETIAAIRDNNDNLNITYNNEIYKIKGVPYDSDFKLFKNLIKLELIQNGLGAYSYGNISKLSEIKQPNPCNKNLTTFVTLFKQLSSNHNNAQAIMDVISTSQLFPTLIELVKKIDLPFDCADHF